MNDAAALIDAYLLDIPDAPVAVECEQCGAEMYEGDDVLYYDGTLFCSDDCLMRYLVDGGVVRHDILCGGATA
jgi:hypothetical protein